MFAGKKRMGQRERRERVSLYLSTYSVLFFFFFFLSFFFVFFLKVMQCCIIQFPVEIRNRGWQGELIAATRDEFFWEGWMGGHPGSGRFVSGW